MDVFPAYFPLAGRTVAIVGDGEAAEAKARLFEGSPARLLRIGQDRGLDPAAYEDAGIAFIAAGDSGFRQAAATAARRAGAIVNVVDHPELCDFHTPALVDRGAVVAAVGTTGAAPLLAALLRNDIEAQIPAGAGRVAALFGAMRERLSDSLPDLDARRAFLREALTGPAAEAALAGDMAAARRLLEAALAGWNAEARRPGRLWVIEPGAEADLLSLRAARVLARADVLIADDATSSAVLSLARREARRLSPDAADLAAIGAAAEQGLQIVWAAGREIDPGLARALAVAGVEVRRLRPAPP